MLLTGSFTVPQIFRTANQEWGYRTIVTAKQGGKPLGQSMLYRLFKNPMSYGLNIRPDGSEFMCSHKPMITEEEFWKAQLILGKKGRPKPRKGSTSAYTDSLIRCDECGCSITVDPKVKHLKNGKTIYYEYYRCTKKRGACSQPYIEVKELEKQIDEVLASIVMTQHCREWLIKYFDEANKDEEKTALTIYKTQHRTLEIIAKELFNLTTMRRKEQIEEDEFIEQRNALLAERRQLQERVGGTEYRIEKWLELAEKTFDFSSRCRYWFEHGDFADKKVIVHTISGSNITLRIKIFISNL